MTTKRSFYVMLGLIGLTIVGLFSVIYFGNKLLVEESGKLVDLKAVSSVLETEQTGLVKAQRSIDKYKNLEEITQAIVPQDKDQARAVREIVTLASESGIELQSVTFPASNLGALVAPTKGKKPEEDPAAAKKIISQAVPVEGVKGVYSIEATIIPQKEISYSQLIDFLSKLEKNRRTAQVTRIKIEPKSSDRNNSKLKVTLTVNIFLKP